MMTKRSDGRALSRSMADTAGRPHRRRSSMRSNRRTAGLAYRCHRGDAIYHRRHGHVVYGRRQHLPGRARQRLCAPDAGPTRPRQHRYGDAPGGRFLRGSDVHAKLRQRDAATEIPHPWYPQSRRIDTAACSRRAARVLVSAFRAVIPGASMGLWAPMRNNNSG